MNLTNDFAGRDTVSLFSQSGPSINETFVCVSSARAAKRTALLGGTSSINAFRSTTGCTSIRIVLDTGAGGAQVA